MIPMQRRELMQMIAALTGSAFIGHDALWAAGDPEGPSAFTDADVEFFDDVAETILPRTDTPGARDAGVGQFIARYSAACYPPEHVALLKSGIADLDAQMQLVRGTGFRRAGEEARTALLVRIDGEAKEHARMEKENSSEKSPHYFTLMKQLTLYGFFTSEPGQTRVIRYRPIPGRYKGCIPYVKGETFWAW
jgi:hypothetical protein